MKTFKNTHYFFLLNYLKKTITNKGGCLNILKFQLKHLELKVNEVILLSEYYFS